MKNKTYKEGDFFAVPTRHGYVLARIARVGRRGGILLGYFFEPLMEIPPKREDVSGFKPNDAFLIKMFCDPGLVKDGWPIIGSDGFWSRSDWPLPNFGRLNDFKREWGFSVQYDEDDLSIDLREKPITAEETLGLPPDGLSGHIYLQGILERYFEEPPKVYNPNETRKVHLWFQGLPGQPPKRPPIKSPLATAPENKPTDIGTELPRQRRPIALDNPKYAQYMEAANKWIEAQNPNPATKQDESDGQKED